MNPREAKRLYVTYSKIREGQAVIIVEVPTQLSELYILYALVGKKSPHVIMYNQILNKL